MTTYELRSVDKLGADVAGVLIPVAVSPLVDSLNRAGSLSFALHNLDPKAAQVEAIGTEVQVWRNGTLYADGGWLVPVTPDARLADSDDVVEFECRGLLWYLDRRYFGDADRHDYLAGVGTFETVADFTAWTVSGTTATRDTTRRVNGAAAAKLVQASADTDTYISRTVSITAGGVGALMTVAAWFYVDPTGFVGEAAGGRGLFIQRLVGGVVQDFNFAELINDGGDVPTGVWQRREVEVTIPPNTTEDIEVRLYSPGGTIWWDEVTLTAMDSLSYYEEDLATIATGIIAHAQDAAYGKSHLNFGITASATGVTKDRHYQHAEHPNIGRSLYEFTTADDGFDQSITVATTPSVSRSYTVHYPRKGTARSALAWSEVVSARWVPVDGEQAANSIVVLGDGDGPDREEGAAVDAAALGGVTLEEVIAAPTGTPIDGLDGKAAEELRVRSTAARLEVTLGPGLRVGSMAAGDTFAGPAAPMAGHYMDLTGTWRAVQVSLDLVSDCLSIMAEVA